MKLLLSIFLTVCLGLTYGQVTVDTDPENNRAADLDARVKFDSIHFSIQPPKHFQLQENFFGFIHPGVGGSIAIAHIPKLDVNASSDEYAAHNFEETGTKLIGQEKVVLNSKQTAKLFLVHFTIQEVLMERLVLFVGNETTTYMVYANYPALMNSLLYPVMLGSFKSIEFE